MAKEIILTDWLMKKLPPAERFHEILRFLIVGGGCFLLEYVLLYMFTEFAGIPYLTSSAIAFLISLLVNYLLCVTVVFHTGKRTKMEMFLFFCHICGRLGNQPDDHVVLCGDRRSLVYVCQGYCQRYRHDMELCNKAVYPERESIKEETSTDCMRNTV